MKNTKIIKIVKALIFWFIVITCFVGIPSSILLWTGNEYLTIQENKAQINFNMTLQKIAVQANKFTNAETFWSSYLFNNIANTKQVLSINELLNWLAKNNNQSPKQYEYIVWDTKGKIASQSFQSEYPHQMWREMLTVLLPYAKKQKYARYFQSIVKRNLNLKILRTLLGKDFNIKSIFHDFRPYGKKLINVELSGLKSKLWFSFTPNYLVAVFINPAHFPNKPGINFFLKNNKVKKYHIQFGTYLPYNNKPIQNISHEEKLPNLLQTFKMMDTNQINFTKNNNSYIGLAFLNPETRIFAQMPNPYSFKIKFTYLLIEAFLILILLSPILIYTFKTIVLKHPETLSIRWKMGLLFLFANGLPLLAMFALSQRYYNHKKQEVIKKIHNKSISMLKNFDNKILSVHAKYEEYIQDFTNDWAKTIGKETITHKQYLEINNKLKKLHPKEYFLVSSKYNCLVTEEGVNTKDYSNQIDKLTGKSLSNKDKDKVLMSSLGKYLMNSLNGNAAPNSAMLKIGLFAESILQKSLTEITHISVKALENISAWELQKNSNLSFLKFIRTPNSRIIDYMLIIIWDTSRLEDVAIKSSILSANRNSLHLKLVARKVNSKKLYPQNFKTSTELTRFLDLVSDRPNDEIETIIHNKEKYLCVGFKGIKLGSYQLAGLYPMKEVDRVISNQQKDMLLLILFSTLLATGLAQLLSKSFNSPLQLIENTALSIERREFEHKINTTAKDEFGEIINIFNNAMVGLEELQVAKVVQESLFPSSNLVSGNFNTYGKIVSKSDLGGTHYDYFDIDEDYFGIFFAKVLDKGVSAALVMAMAKAGLISSKNTLLEPSKLVNNISSLIHNTKHGKTTELIQLQYVCINKKTGCLTYANINMEPPIIRRNNKDWEFLKDNCSEQHLFSGDLIIFYTNCFKTNVNNNESLPNLIISSPISDVKMLCENIITTYLSTKKNLTNLEDVGIVISSHTMLQEKYTNIED